MSKPNTGHGEGVRQVAYLERDSETASESELTVSLLLKQGGPGSGV
ncbi:MAG: hypothetical protein JWN02_495 [Acidobacteria bacterium]|nr:hypothetical protein [Acidobacteriota bacterium]